MSIGGHDAGLCLNVLLFYICHINHVFTKRDVACVFFVLTKGCRFRMIPESLKLNVSVCLDVSPVQHL